MYLKCKCGTVLDDIAAPNDVEHKLVSYRAMERLQDLVDAEVAGNGRIQEWPEHWDHAGTVEVWRCYTCGRLHVNPRSVGSDRLVYAIEHSDERGA